MKDGKSIWTFDLFELFPFRVRIHLRILRPRMFRARALALLFRELSLFTRHGFPLDRALAGISSARSIRMGFHGYIAMFLVFLVECYIIFKLASWLIIEKLSDPAMIVPAAFILAALLLFVQVLAAQIFRVLLGVIISLLFWYLSFPVWFFILPLFIMLSLRLNLTNAKINYTKFVRYLARDLHRRMLAGVPLSEAMKRDPRVFSDFEVAMVKTGEQSGRLPEMLQMLADYERQRGKFEFYGTKNIVYPIALAVMAAIIIGFVLLRIIPKFEEIFSVLGAALPGMTWMLIQISRSIIHHFFYYLVALILLLYLWSIVRRHLLLPGLYLPLFRAVYRPLFASRFLLSVGYQLQAGITLPEACKTASGMSPQRAMKRDFLRRLLPALENGQSFSTALERVAWFPQKAIRLIALSEFADNLDKRLPDVAHMLLEESEQQLLRTTRWLGPIAHFCVAMILLFTIVSLYLPLFSVPMIIR
jgi:type IV pilus assembly protein PilC